MVTNNHLPYNIIVTSSRGSCHDGGSWRTVPCLIPGCNGDGVVTVLLQVCQSIFSRGSTHRHCTTTSHSTYSDSEGVCDDVGVHYVPSRLAPGEGDRGGLDGGVVQTSGCSGRG